MRRVLKLLIWAGVVLVLLAGGVFGFLLYNEHRFIADNGLVRTGTAIEMFEGGCFTTIVGAVRATDVDEAMRSNGLEPGDAELTWKHPHLRLDTRLFWREGGGNDCLVTFLPGYLWPGESEHAMRAAFSDYVQGRLDRGMTEVAASHLNLEPLSAPRAEPLVAGFEDDRYRYYLVFEPHNSGLITFRLVSEPVQQS